MYNERNIHMSIIKEKFIIVEDYLLQEKRKYLRKLK